jgi:hypothetical protein
VQEHVCYVAAHTNGVIALEDHLTVFPPAPTPSPSGLTPLAPTGLPADQALAERIRTRYYWTAGLHDEELKVRVVDGCATLTGTVDTWLEHQLAAHVALEAGAREVANHLCVVQSPGGCDD